MKLTKSKLIALMLGFIFIISLSIFAITTQVSNVAFADTATLETSDVTNDTNSDEFVVLDSQNIVPATYTFTKLNDKECSVRIANKTTANTAVIPTFGEINGVEYRVVEIAANGFMSSTNLVRVSLPIALRKIGNMAFYNCSKLERINLSNVEVIGNNVFYKCLKLEEIIIPASVKSMGTYVFKNNNTTVKLRADSEPEGWLSSWNTNNNNQSIVYGCKDIQPLELETIYNTTARSVSPTVSYSLAGGQPRTDNFYLNPDNFDDYVEREGNNIFVPSSFNGVGINAISGEAFAGVSFDQLIIEYGDEPIKIGNNVFLSANSEDEREEINSAIVINREIVFTDVFEDYVENNESDNIFIEAKVKAIVLPNNLTRIPSGTFSDCNYLENIYFRKPEDISDRKEMLGIISEAEKENNNEINQDESIDLTQLGHSSVVYLPKSIEFIGAEAFSSNNQIRILNIYENVTEVGSRIVSYWDDETQLVKVHNTKKIEYGEGKWAEDWAAEFKNYQLDKEIYTIHFDTSGGFLSAASIDVEYGKEIGLLPEPYWELHRFNGWKNSKDLQFFNGNTLPARSDLYLIADWATQYLVNLKSEDGSKTLSTVYAVYGENLPLTDINGDAVKISEDIGTDFVGYYDSDKETIYYGYIDGQLVATNVWDKKFGCDIFAKNNIINYQIIYNGADISNLSNPNPKTFTYQNVKDNSFNFTPILNGSKKIYWSLNNIGEAKKTNYLESRILYVTGTLVNRRAKITYTGIDYGNYNNSTYLNYNEVYELKEPTVYS